MSGIYSCITGKFGPWEYFHITMKASDVATKLMLPKELPGWKDLTLEEKFQRKLNENRVTKQIAPYLLHNKFRFFSSILVTVINGDDMKFTPIKKYVKEELGPIYVNSSSNMGFLEFSGQEQLVPLDGQHRYAAIKTAITGKTISNKEIEDMIPNPNLGKDNVSIILIRHTSKSRHIFNKINRYAKPTAKGDNIITSDDDVVAIISREMCDYDELNSLKGRLVTIEGTTLGTNAGEFTTLSTLYDTNVDIIKENNHDFDPSIHPGTENYNIFKNEILNVWKILFKKIDLWKDALQNQDESGDDIRRDLRSSYTILKPFGQRALVKAYLFMLLRYKKKSGGAFTSSEICNKLNKVNWKLENETWRGIMTKSGDRIESGKDNLQLSAKLISHLCGADIDDEGFREKYERKAGHGLPRMIKD